MRLINLDKLLEELDKEVKLADDWKTAHEFYNVVKYFPTVDSCADCKEAYGRSKGEWILEKTDYDEGGNNLYRCNVCHHSDTHSGSTEVPYCWYCGADMRGGTDNDPN